MFTSLYTQLKSDKEAGLKKASKKIGVESLQYATKFIAALPQDRLISVLDGARKANGVITSEDGESILAQDLKALILIVNNFSVGFYLDVKSQASQPTFSTAVPYVLYCHKLHHGTTYESWRQYDFTPKIINSYLRQLFLYEGDIPSYSADKLLELRQKAIVRAGSVQAPTAWTLVRTGEEDFDALPQCVRRMLLQSWMHNVENRNKWMINDPSNWDNMPTILEEGYDAEGNVIDELAGW